MFQVENSGMSLARQVMEMPPVIQAASQGQVVEIL